jgi:hypothetical protein
VSAGEAAVSFRGSRFHVKKISLGCLKYLDLDRPEALLSPLLGNPRKVKAEYREGQFKAEYRGAMMKCVILLSVVLLAGMLGCSSSTTEVEQNNPPTIAFTFNRLAVPKGIDVDLSVYVSDADDDPLTVTWEATGGLLDPDDQGKTVMTWTPPTAVGKDTISATVSDGKATKSSVIVLETGTAWNTWVQGGVTKWTTANSPYIITAPPDYRFVVGAFATLEINAGVTVYIDDQDLEFMVEGTLKINGNPTHMVNIKPNRINPENGFWSGIRANPNSSSPLVVLNYARISKGVNGVRADEISEVRTDGSIFVHSSEAGVFHRSSGDLHILRSNIIDNEGMGILIEKLTSYPDSIIIRDSNIRFNQASGIEIELPDTYGVSVVEINGDSIALNSKHGINLSGGVYPQIHNNAIFFNDVYRQNGGFNLHIETFFHGINPYINAIDNYWGASYEWLADSNDVAQMIFDHQDNVNIPVRVWFVPWCNDHPVCEPPQ